MGEVPTDLASSQLEESSPEDGGGEVAPNGASRGDVVKDPSMSAPHVRRPTPARSESAPSLFAGKEAMNENAASTDGPEEAPAIVPSPTPAPFGWNLTRNFTIPRSLCLGLIFAWFLLAGVRGFLLVRQILEVRRVKRNSTSPGPSLQIVFEKLRASLARRQHVQAKISPEHRTAGLLGFFHPVILLPTDMDHDLDHNESEHVLRHELAHLERRDDW